MASKAFPHVIVRNGWYHYHRRVPSAVLQRPEAWERLFERKPHFRRSLFTNVYREALKAAAVVAEEFEGLVSEALSPTPAVVHQHREFCAEALAEIAGNIRDQLILEWRNMIRRAKVSPDEDYYLTIRLDQIIDRPDPADQMTALLGMAPIEKARRLNQQYGFNLDETSDAFAELILAVEDGCTAAREGIQEIFKGKSLPSQSSSTLINQYSRSKSDSASLTLREVVERYLQDKRVRPKTAMEINASLELFEGLVGYKRLDQLTRDDFIGYIEMLAAKKIGGRSIGSIARSASKGTVQKRVGFLRTAINHAIKKNWHKGGNPAAGFDISAWTVAPDKTIMPDKRPFRLYELNKVFQHSWFTGCKSVEQPHLPGNVRLRGSHYWVPIVALFTGCRASELGGLMVSEVFLEDATPHLHIRPNKYRGTKGDQFRFVPLLDALLELGFGSYVKAIQRLGAERVFPDWQPPKRTGDFDKDDARWSNAGLIKSFNRTVVPKQLKDSLTPGARLEVTFHNFRGAFKSMLGLKKHNVPPNVINEVIGHSKSEMDKRYVAEVPLEETYPAIHTCGWPDLALPPAPPLPEILPN